MKSKDEAGSFLDSKELEGVAGSPCSQPAGYAEPLVKKMHPDKVGVNLQNYSVPNHSSGLRIKIKH